MKKENVGIPDSNPLHNYQSASSSCSPHSKAVKGAGNTTASASCCCSAEHDDDDSAPNDEHDHSAGGSTLRMFAPALISFALLAIGLCFDHVYKVAWFVGVPRFIWYLLAYIPVGFPVLFDAWKSILRGNFFSEFFLMGIATIGAFIIGVFPEGVAVMLFYAVGETFQGLAVRRAKSNIKALLDQRPDTATVIRNGSPQVLPAKMVQVDDIIQLKPGEKLALDAVMLSDSGSFNTAALTGESKPDTKYKDDTVLAGMINLNTLVQVRVTTAYADSKLSKILALVQDASKQKAPTELFIAKFARVYTPIVVFLALGIMVLPALFVENYVFTDWFYRALVFLVISCPCALVISIPLGYFGGIGAASKNGILVKGSNFLDILSDIKQVVMDKTGTMTEGVFEVQEVKLALSAEKDFLLAIVNALENSSSHPVASAIHRFVGPVDATLTFDLVEEIPGHGLRGVIDGKEVLVGNFKLLDRYAIPYTVDTAGIVYTVLAIAFDKQYAGYITIADKIKPDAFKAIQQLHDLGVTAVMLSGDKDSVVQHVARELRIDHAYGDLLPADKVSKVNEIKLRQESVAFVGDGINDAPVVALSDVGIAMGGLGADATIETADVVIQDDNPNKIPMAIRIGKKTKKIVYQNIGLAFGVKAIVLILGAGGLASMWEAVFADVGVALLAILNAVRIQRTNFHN
ncbi:heavy metal translocating P-type ATPase [Sphingobacterium sp. Mn56C]|uniref:heavy metal translocating P-type ATPase n=1 Tax=Sphingobacterium sp. Mn56C TaxID=3395261 RepID=UPI003BDA1332